MSNLVSIKSLKDGLCIRLDSEADFVDVYEEMCDKFRESAKFFGDAKIVVSFEGRDISNDEEQALIDGISLNSDLTVLCVIGKDEEKNERFLRASNTFKNSGASTDGQYYRGTLRAHENLETDTSIIILGDVNPGASVTSKGNIVILGTLYGTARAGSDGNKNSFVVTLDMKSARVEIADVSSEVVLRASVFSKNKIQPRISYIDGREIVTEEITRELLGNLPI